MKHGIATLPLTIDTFNALPEDRRDAILLGIVNKLDVAGYTSIEVISKDGEHVAKFDKLGATQEDDKAGIDDRPTLHTQN